MAVSQKIITKLYKKKTLAENIITKNLHTEGGHFLLNGVDYTGDYHLHHTGEAMTGADHSDSSEVLTIIGREKRTKQIIRTIKRTPEGRGGRY